MGDLRRTLLALSFSACAFSVIATVFWFEDLRYARPAARPAGLEGPAVGARVALPPALAALRRHPDNPALVHFFNPHCPCSRFNIDHVRELVAAHRGQVEFIAVLQGTEPEDLDEDFGDYGLDIAAVVDPQGEIAEALGVYAAPTAVILAPGERLYYRGNYNVSRYCADPETQFARLSLEELLAAEPPPEVAQVAFGCPLPSYAAWRTEEVP